MNGDGYSDIIIGARIGTIYVVFGHNNIASYNNIDLASSTFTNSGLGFKVSVYFITCIVIMLINLIINSFVLLINCFRYLVQLLGMYLVSVLVMQGISMGMVMMILL